MASSTMATAAALAAFVSPAAAFVPTSNLRAATSGPARGEGQSSSDYQSYVGASFASAAVVAGAIAMRPRQAKTQRNVVPLSNVDFKALFPKKKRAGGDFLPREKGGFGKDLGMSEVGCCYPIATKWDPLNLGNTDAKMDRYTQVEIKHGRVAMVATVGYIVPDIFRWPGCEDVKHGLAALNTLPFEGWIQILALIGAHEVLVKPREGGMGPSDFGQGTYLLENCSDAEIMRKQTAERNNGRLAMVAILGMMWQNGQFGLPPLEELQTNGWWGSGVSYLVDDLPFCASRIDQADPAAPYMCALPKRNRKIARRAVDRYVVPLDDEKLKDRKTLGPETEYRLLERSDFTPRQLSAAGISPEAGTMDWTPGKVWEDNWGDDAFVREWDADPEMSPAVPFMKFPTPLKGWVGGEKGFDPLGISDSFPVYCLREAELKHGRVCMLATLGWIAVDCGLRFPGEKYQAVPSAFQAVPMLYDSGTFDVGFIFFPIEMTCWMLYISAMFGEVNREAGDFYIGKQFLPKDPEQAKSLQLKELENGRLAMLAFSGIVTQAALPANVDKVWPFLD